MNQAFLMPLTLLFENEEWNRNVSARRLAHSDSLTQSVADERCGREFVRLEPPYLILRNLALSAMDGRAVAGYLKGAPPAGLIPPVAPAVRALPSDGEAGSDLGYNDVKTRSANLPRLVEKTRLFLAQAVCGERS